MILSHIHRRVPCKQKHNQYLWVDLEGHIRKTTQTTQTTQSTHRIQNELCYRPQYQPSRRIMGTKTTFNQNKYIKFLKTLLLKIKQSRDNDQQKIVVIADNWRFHRTEHMRSLLLNERVVWLFIPPYWPEINPWEKLINFIKGYVKSQVNIDM